MSIYVIVFAAFAKCQTPSKRWTNERKGGQRDASLSVRSSVCLLVC